MRVKALSRNPADHVRETTQDIHKVARNYDPDLHPFEASREYMRSLNAAKLGRIFAKPFTAGLEGHRDGLTCMGKHPERLSVLVSGCADGEIRLWDLARRKCMLNFQAHDGMVKGISFFSDGDKFLSVGFDKTVKTWDTTCPDSEDLVEPLNTILSKTSLTGVSHKQNDPIFATCGDKCQIWDETRNEPISSYQWGVDTMHTISFNPVQTNVLATCASDNSIILYDTRNSGPIRKLITTMQMNKVCWNPMEAFNFVCASEDYNLYTFDMRRLNQASIVHKNHTSAVLDVDFAPTGKEFVSGSYDKTIRIFPSDQGTSREVYHTPRMQRLSCVLWSMDNKYVLCGSNEMNIRVWKAQASEKLGVLKPREVAAKNYNDALKAKYAAYPHVRRIDKHRHVPKHVYNATKEHRIMALSRARKDDNTRKHSKPGTLPFVHPRKKAVVEEKH